jgi:hypothetical protein
MIFQLRGCQDYNKISYRYHLGRAIAPVASSLKPGVESEGLAYSVKVVSMKLVALFALALAAPALAHSEGRATPQMVAQAPGETPPVSRMERLREADAELRAANAALAQADAQLALGKEPLPGERTGNANGMSRLNDAYWARQAQNEEAVKQAKARRDAAVAARNAARF